MNDLVKYKVFATFESKKISPLTYRYINPAPVELPPWVDQKMILKIIFKMVFKMILKMIFLIGFFLKIRLKGFVQPFLGNHPDITTRNLLNVPFYT